MTQESFDQHCIVEIMGHSRIAGRVTEQAIGGTNFVRVDVPAVNGNPAYTRLLGSAAIYAINPVDEEIALEAAKQFRAVPVQPYEIPALRQQSLEYETPPSPPWRTWGDDEEEEEMDRDGDWAGPPL